MDPAKKIEALELKIIGYEADLTNLKAQLAIAPTPEEKSSIAQLIHDLYKQLDRLEDQLTGLHRRVRVRVQDPRPLKTKA